jgi:hypothetical protein
MVVNLVVIEIGYRKVKRKGGERVE